MKQTSSHMDVRSYIWGLSGVVLCFLLGFFTYWYYYGSPGRYEADSLVFPNLYTFIKEGGGAFKDWPLPYAAHYFDLCLYWLVRTVVVDVHATQAAVSSLQTLLFTGALFLLSRSLSNDSRQLSLYAALCPLIVLFALQAGGLFYFIGIPVYHFMGFLHTLVAIALLLSIERNSTTGKRLLFCLWCSVCMISDDITVLWLFIPCLTFFIAQWLVLRRKEVLQMASLLLLSFASAKILSSLLGLLFPRASIADWGSPSIGSFFKKLPEVLLALLGQWGQTPISILLVCLACLGIVVTGKRYIARGRRRQLFSEPAGILLILIFFIFGANVSAVAALGYVEQTRYAMAAVFLPVYGGIFLLFTSAKLHKLTRFTVFFTLASLAICGTRAYQAWENRQKPYYPEYIQKIDLVVRERGLRTGAANYWLAHPIQALSHEGIQVLPLRGRYLLPSPLNGPLNAPPADVDFFLTDTRLDRAAQDEERVSAATVEAVNGPPDAVVPIEGYSLLFYENSRSRLASLVDLYEQQILFAPPPDRPDTVLWEGEFMFSSGACLMEIRKVFRHKSQYIVLILGQKPDFFWGKDFIVGAVGEKASIFRRSLAAFLEESPDSLFAPLYRKFYKHRTYKELSSTQVGPHPLGSILVARLPDRESRKHISLYVSLDGDIFHVPVNGG